MDFDAAGRVSQLSDPANASLQSAYQYDALDRLNTVQKGSPLASTLQYSYDAVGNRQTSQVDSATITSTYDTGSNRLQSMAGAIDALYMLGVSSVSFTYNNANRLVQIQAGASTVASYLVNALGQRVQKAVSGAVTQFVYDEAGHLIGEYDGSGQLIQETVWMEDMPVATLRPTGTGTPTPIAIYYVHVDHLGTPRAITRPSDNAVMWRWDNTDPFGNNPPNENPAGQGVFGYNLRFPGQYFDAEIGTHYNYFRDYDPSIGRYVESDPIGLDAGPNTYGYVGGNPLSYFDPRGKAGTAVGCAAGAWFGPIGCGIGAAIGTAGTIILGGIIANSIGSDSENDPVKDQKPFNPGRDCDGKCNPCPPTIKWDADGNRHGSTSGRHGHGIRWDQNPQTCWCYPSRLSGPSTDSLK